MHKQNKTNETLAKQKEYRIVDAIFAVVSEFLPLAKNLTSNNVIYKARLHVAGQDAKLNLS